MPKIIDIPSPEGFDYPITVKSATDRLAYAFRTVEKLREIYAFHGALVKTGDSNIEDFRKWKYGEWLPRNKSMLHSIESMIDRLAKYPIHDPRSTPEKDEQIVRETAQTLDTTWDKLLPKFEAIPRISITPVPPCPVEDFTAYNEYDPGSDITKTATQITVVNADYSSGCRVNSDKGVAHWPSGTGWEHLTSWQGIVSVSNFQQWAISDADTTYIAAFTSTDFMIQDHWEGGTTQTMVENGSTAYEQWWSVRTAAAVGNWNYMEEEMDPSVGANGTYYRRCYSDAARLVPVDIAGAINLHYGYNGRWIYGMCSRGSGSGIGSFNVANLDLQETIIVVPVPGLLVQPRGIF